MSNLWPKPTCLASKSMCSSYVIEWWPGINSLSQSKTNALVCVNFQPIVTIDMLGVKKYVLQVGNSTGVNR